MKKFKIFSIIIVGLACFWFNISKVEASTVNDLQALIAELQQKMNQANQELNEISVPSTSSVSSYTFNSNLKYGDQGADVEALQEILKNKGYVVSASEDSSNYFGNSTKAAVIKFQEMYASEILSPWGLTYGTGNVGTTTRAKLNQFSQPGYIASDGVIDDDGLTLKGVDFELVSTKVSVSNNMAHGIIKLQITPNGGPLSLFTPNYSSGAHPNVIVVKFADRNNYTYSIGESCGITPGHYRETQDGETLEMTVSCSVKSDPRYSGKDIRMQISKIQYSLNDEVEYQIFSNFNTNYVYLPGTVASRVDFEKISGVATRSNSSILGTIELEVKPTGGTLSPFTVNYSSGPSDNTIIVGFSYLNGDNYSGAEECSVTGNGTIFDIADGETTLLTVQCAIEENAIPLLDNNSLIMKISDIHYTFDDERIEQSMIGYQTNYVDPVIIENSVEFNMLSNSAYVDEAAIAFEKNVLHGTIKLQVVPTGGFLRLFSVNYSSGGHPNVITARFVDTNGYTYSVGQKCNVVPNHHRETQDGEILILTVTCSVESNSVQGSKVLRMEIPRIQYSLDVGTIDILNEFGNQSFDNFHTGWFFLRETTISSNNNWCNGADTNKDGSVDGLDITNIISQWTIGQDASCFASSWCNGADTNKDGKVDLQDQQSLTSNWGRSDCAGSVGMISDVELKRVSNRLASISRSIVEVMNAVKKLVSR